MTGIVTAANKANLPRFIHVIYAFPGGDKLAHFVLFGLLAGALSLAVGSHAVGRGKRVFLANLVLAVIVALEELSQRYFSARTFSLLDLAASYLGIACCAAAAYYWLSKR